MKNDKLKIEENLMIGDPIYASDKFSYAIYLLAVGEDDVRSRLYEAYLEFCAVTEKDIPDYLVEDFTWIHNSLTKYSSRFIGTCFYEGSIKATLRRIRKKTGRKIAERIFSLNSQLEDYLAELENK